MSDRGRQPAIASFVHALQQGLSCVTQAVLIQERQATNDRWTARLAGDRAALSGPRPLTLSMLLDFVVSGRHDNGADWGVQTVGYWYEIRHAAGPMVFAYHWHPVGPSPITWPHLHLRGDVAGISFAKVHLPTGPITLQELLRFVIVDLNVAPRRDDWEHVLSAP